MEATPELESLLTEAKTLWASTKKGYRDGMIQVGRLVLKYVRGRMAQGDGKNEMDRRRMGISRRLVVQRAAEVLEDGVPRINGLIHLAATSECLEPETGWGSLSFTSIRSLRCLVHRPNRGHTARSRGVCLKNSVLPSATEVWSIRKGLEKGARQLVESALANGWDSKRVKTEVVSVMKGKGLKHWFRPTRLEATTSDDNGVVRGRVLDLLLAVDDPWDTLEQVKELLEMRMAERSERSGKVDTLAERAAAGLPLFG